MRIVIHYLAVMNRQHKPGVFDAAVKPVDPVSGNDRRSPSTPRLGSIHKIKKQAAGSLLALTMQGSG
jgi:hypothetical protein